MAVFLQVVCGLTMMPLPYACMWDYIPSRTLQNVQWLLRVEQLNLYDACMLCALAFCYRLPMHGSVLAGHVEAHHVSLPARACGTNP
jgi:hypothetical protein